MNDTVCIGTGAVDGTMNGKTAGVGTTACAIHDLALGINQQQIGGADLIKAQTKGIDQENVVVAGQAQGNMGVDDIVPALAGRQPVSGGQIDAGAPVLGINIRRTMGVNGLQVRRDRTGLAHAAVVSSSAMMAFSSS